MRGFFMEQSTAVSVRDIMTEELIVVKTRDKVIKAIEVMTENDIGSVVVVDDERPVGIVTERDVMKRVCPEKLCTKGITVREIMNKPLIHIEANAGLGQAFSLMMLRDVRRLLVVDKGQVAGIITQKDVMKGAFEIFMSLALR
jgi:CBS domain-containing protein